MSEFRPVPGCSQYDLSDEGVLRSYVRSRRSGKPRVLKCTPNLGGYPWIELLADDGSRISRGLHSLVLLTFVGPRPPDLDCIRHLDGDRLNNRLSNLRYGTWGENAQDSLRHGTNCNAGKTHCKYGHEYTPENTYQGTKNRACRKCNAAAAASYARRQRAAAASPTPEDGTDE